MYTKKKKSFLKKLNWKNQTLIVNFYTKLDECDLLTYNCITAYQTELNEPNEKSLVSWKFCFPGKSYN